MFHRPYRPIACACVLLPLTEAVLDSQAQLLVARGFEKVEAEQGPTASIEHAEAVVDRLAAALGD